MLDPQDAVNQLSSNFCKDSIFPPKAKLLSTVSTSKILIFTISEVDLVLSVKNQSSLTHLLDKISDITKEMLPKRKSEMQLPNPMPFPLLKVGRNLKEVLGKNRKKRSREKGLTEMLALKGRISPEVRNNELPLPEQSSEIPKFCS